MALGNVGVPVGTEFVITAAGALVATGHLSSLPLAVGVAVAGELAGAGASYAVGRYGGRAVVHRYGRYVLFHENEMATVDRFFARYGSFAIFLCRFIPVVRGVCSIPAGIARMAIVPFFVFTALGSLGFCALLAIVGHQLGAHLDSIVPLLHRTSLLVAAAVVAAIVLVIVLALVRRGKARQA